MTSLSSRLTIISILILAFILRIYRLSTYDFWFDEVLCIFQREDIKNILNGRMLDSNPPLYFLFLNLWGRLGESEFWFRLPSVIFGVINVYVLYSVAKKIFNEHTALMASYLLSISPFHIYYSQEVKMYSLFILLSFMSFSSLLFAVKTNEKRYYFYYSFVTTCCLYIHYYAFYLIFIEIVSVSLCCLFISEWKKVLRNFLISLLGTGTAYLPWIPVMLNEHFFRTSGFVTTWIPKPGLKTFFYTFKNFSVGFSSPRVNYLIASFVYGVAFLGGLRIVLKDKIREYYFLLLFVVLTPVFLFILSQYRPVYLDRYISFILPFFILIVAVGMKHIKGKWAVAMVVLTMCFSFYGYKDMYEVIPYIHQAPGEHERIQIKEPVSYLKSKWEKGDLIGHSCRSTLLSFEYYWGNSPEQKLIATSLFEKYPQPSEWNHSNLLPQIVPDSLKGKGNIWLVLSWWDPLDNLDPISMELKKWMDKHFSLKSEKRFKGIFIYEYSRSNVA